MHSSLCERRLHPDEEGSFQSVIRSQKTGTAGLHWEKKKQHTQKHETHVQRLIYENKFPATRSQMNTDVDMGYITSIWSQKVKTEKPTQFETSGIILIGVKQINTVILSAGPVSQSQLLSNCQSSQSSSGRSNSEMSKHVKRERRGEGVQAQINGLLRRNTSSVWKPLSSYVMAVKIKASYVCCMTDTSRIPKFHQNKCHNQTQDKTDCQIIAVTSVWQARPSTHTIPHRKCIFQHPVNPPTPTPPASNQKAAAATEGETLHLSAAVGSQKSTAYS